MIGEIIRTLLIAAGGKFLADETKEWLTWLSPKLIRWAASQFESDRRGRFEEEWLAHCNDLPGNGAKILHAAGCVGTALRMTNASKKAALRLLIVPFVELMAFSEVADESRKSPEEMRSRRLRRVAGGLTVLGLNDLELKNHDWTPYLRLFFSTTPVERFPSPSRFTQTYDSVKAAAFSRSLKRFGLHVTLPTRIHGAFPNAFRSSLL
jgi:hypothetical protein